MPKSKWIGWLLPLVLIVSLSGKGQHFLSAGSSETIYLPLVSVPPRGPNLLPNPSFEGGWYHPNGIPELQIPEDWQFASA